MSNVFEIFLKLQFLCNEGSIYIYEYMLIFFSKFWVCLGIQGHTPGPPLATIKKYFSFKICLVVYPITWKAKTQD